MRYKFDILVIGGGIHGAAIFYNLLKKTNKRVALLEKKQFCSGATGSAGGFIRVLHQSSLLTDLALHSVVEFNEFEKIFGQSCDFAKTGFYTIEKSTNLPGIEKKLQWLNQQNASITCLSHDEVIRLHHTFNLAIHPDEVIIYENNAGYANPIKATRAYISSGIKLGGFAAEHTEILDILIQNGRITGAKTSSTLFEAPCIVLAAGVGCITLLSKLGIETPGISSRLIQVDCYQYSTSGQQIPTFFDSVFGLYGRNYPFNKYLLGTTSPSQTQLKPDNQPSTNIAQKRIPFFNAMTWQHRWGAMDVYTDTNESFTKFVDEISGLFICTGWNGAGFKVAPESAKRIVSQLQQHWN